MSSLIGNRLLPYQKDYESIVTITQAMLSGQKTPKPIHPYQSVLKKQIAKLLKREQTLIISPQFSNEDISQEIAMIWLHAQYIYKEKSPKIHLRQYLIRRSIWGIRNWIQKELKICSSAEEAKDTIQTPEDIMFKPLEQVLMEAMWAHRLSPGHFYLLYLTAIKGLSMREVGDAMSYERHAIARYLAKVRQELSL